jgi:hypothetical protein
MLQSANVILQFYILFYFINCIFFSRGNNIWQGFRFIFQKFKAKLLGDIALYHAIWDGL